jgi:hypothetical protein
VEAGFPFETALNKEFVAFYIIEIKASLIAYVLYAVIAFPAKVETGFASDNA